MLPCHAVHAIHPTTETGEKIYVLSKERSLNLDLALGIGSREDNKLPCDARKPSKFGQDKHLSLKNFLNGKICIGTELRLYFTQCVFWDIKTANYEINLQFLHVSIIT